MMKFLHNKKQQLIDSYNTGVLSKKDAALLDKFLKEDPEFIKLFEINARFRKELKKNPPNKELKILLENEAEHIRAKNDSYYLDTSIRKEKKRRRFQIFSVAASLLLLICSGNFFIHNNYSNQKIAQSFNIEDRNDTKQAALPEENQLLIGKKLFFEGRFSEAATALKTFPKSVPDTYYEAKVYYALSLFKLNEFEVALPILNQLIEQDFEHLPIAFKTEDRLRWKRLLAYVGAQKIETDFFKSELVYFKNLEGSPYSKSAKDLEDQLSSVWRNLVL